MAGQDIVIVGAGIIGVATAYHLAKTGAGKIRVLDRSGPGSGATGRSGAIVRTALATEVETRLATRSLDVFRTFNEEFETSGAFEQVGMLEIGAGECGANERATAAHQSGWGSSIRPVTRQEALALFPDVRRGDAEVIRFDPTAGVGDAHVILAGYIQRSRMLGVEYEFGARVDAILVKRDRVTGITTKDGDRPADKVIIAAGAWSPALLSTAGIDLDLTARLSRVAVFRPGDLSNHSRQPVVIDGPNKAWFRPMPGGSLLVGAERGGQTGVDPDRRGSSVPDDILDLYEAILRQRFVLGEPVSPRGGWSGVYSLSPDGLPLVGPAPAVGGLFVAVGDHGGAFKIAPALGEGLANMVTGQGDQPIDLTALDPNRLPPPRRQSPTVVSAQNHASRGDYPDAHFTQPCGARPPTHQETPMNRSEKYATMNLGDSLTQYQPFFDDLGPDQHHPAAQGGRTRRLAQYHATFDPVTKSAVLTKLKTQLFLQGETNKLTGHIEREFEDIATDMKPYIENGFGVVDENWSLAPYPKEWLVKVHMVRVHAKPATRGVPVPEGLHKDGADFVVMGCVARQNVKGGISQIHEEEDAPPVYGVTLMPGQALVVDDREVFHMVTPLIADSDEGYRDMILMGFHMWSHGKYRGDWKTQAAELQ